MRISDWSSDVCSSDLLALVALAGEDVEVRLAHQVMPLGEGRRGLGEVIGARRDQAVDAAGDGGGRARIRDKEGRGVALDDRLGDDGRREPRLHVLEEIGRASCRERGCQYV